MNRRHHLQGFLASGLVAAFLFALVLAAAPQLHARFHAEAGSLNHECAVTLIATGKCEQAYAPPIFVAPPQASVFEKVATLAPVWVPAPFFGAAIFEHAPPALS